MQADIEQAGLAAGLDLGHTGERRCFEFAVGKEAQPARPFGDQHPPVGQEGHAPRLFQPARQSHQPVRSLGAVLGTLGTHDGGRGKTGRDCRKYEETPLH
jgi:hypothetical protein